MDKRLKMILTAAALCLNLLLTVGCQNHNIELKSPGAAVAAKFFIDDTGRLTYNLTRQSTVIIEDSPIGITIDDAIPSTNATHGAASRPKQSITTTQ